MKILIEIEYDGKKYYRDDLGLSIHKIHNASEIFQLRIKSFVLEVLGCDV